MTLNGWIQIAIYFVVLTALVVPLGRFMARVFQGERTFLSPVLRPVEAASTGSPASTRRASRHWITYTVAMLLFNAAGFLVSMRSCACRSCLPLNPAGMSAVAPDLTFNTAVSFATNTNWQNYGGESTMSYLTQMVGLTTQNFVSAATGIALAVALIRGFARASAKTVGNFWVDLTRCTLYVLLPLSIIAAIFLVWQGVPQNLGAYVDATTLEGAKQTHQPGPGGLADRHQAARHQWRRLLERELVAFLTRTRPRSATSSRCIYILLISARAHPHLRPHGQGRAAGLGALRRHVDPVPGGSSSFATGRKAPATRNSPRSGSIPPTWRARRSASASPIPACGRLRPPTPRTAPSMPCMTASRRSAA